jgi:hypothetical protein
LLGFCVFIDLWDGHEKHFGKDDAPALCWVATTLESNPTVSKAYIDRKLEEDYESAMAEFFAQWRSDLASFIDIAALKACVDVGVYERPVDYKHRYFGFVDQSGGGSDSFTLCVAHKEGNTILNDCIRETRPPFSPQGVVEEYSRVLKRYRINTIYWLHVEYLKPKSELYLDFLPILNSGGARLLDHTRLFNQIVGLERRTHRSGKDSIDHPRGGKDDIANACAGATVLASNKPAGWAREKRKVFRSVLPDYSGDGTGTGWMGLWVSFLVQTAPRGPTALKTHPTATAESGRGYWLEARRIAANIAKLSAIGETPSFPRASHPMTRNGIVEVRNLGAKLPCSRILNIRKTLALAIGDETVGPRIIRSVSSLSDKSSEVTPGTGIILNLSLGWMPRELIE